MVAAEGGGVWCWYVGCDRDYDEAGAGGMIAMTSWGGASAGMAPLEGGVVGDCRRW